MGLDESVECGRESISHPLCVISVALVDNAAPVVGDTVSYQADVGDLLMIDVGPSVRGDSDGIRTETFDETRTQVA